MRGLRISLLVVFSIVLLLLTIAVATSVGEMPIPLRTTLAVVTNHFGWTNVPVNKIQEGVIWEFRLSRSLVAACCGAGLALCGAILQSLLRNALAEPYVLGVSAGASAGAASIIVLGLGAGALSLSAGAFIGAFCAFLYVLLLSGGAQAGVGKTILAGVAAAHLFGALTSFIVSIAADAQQAHNVIFWLLGSFSGAGWAEFQLVAVVVVIGFVICLGCASALDAFAFGDDAAASLGVSVGAIRLLLFATTAMVTATIVSIVGSIGFVGLIVPHVARFFIGPGHMRLLPASALIGAIFMIIADLIARVILPQQVLPVGIVTALVGVPFFSLILYRMQRGE